MSSSRRKPNSGRKPSSRRPETPLGLGALPDIAGMPAAVVSSRALGGRTLVLGLPPVPEDAPEAVREGIARRWVVLTEGRCPCGAEALRVGPDLVVDHDGDCPASDAVLRPALGAWLEAGGRL